MGGLQTRLTARLTAVDRKTFSENACYRLVLVGLSDEGSESFVWTLFLLVVTRDAHCAASLFSLCSVRMSAVTCPLHSHCHPFKNIFLLLIF